MSAAASVALRKAVNILIDHGRHEVITWDTPIQAQVLEHDPSTEQEAMSEVDGYAAVAEEAFDSILITEPDSSDEHRCTMSAETVDNEVDDAMVDNAMVDEVRGGNG